MKGTVLNCNSSCASISRTMEVYELEVHMSTKFTLQNYLSHWPWYSLIRQT